jgi:hypothetical protein
MPIIIIAILLATNSKWHECVLYVSLALSIFWCVALYLCFRYVEISLKEVEQLSGVRGVHLSLFEGFGATILHRFYTEANYFAIYLLVVAIGAYIANGRAKT